MTTHCFLFKVALKANKRIWRRIVIRGNQTLDDLHECIYDAFDRYDEHLYSFYFPRPGTRGRNRMRDAVEITHPFNAKESSSLFGKRLPDASKIKIDALKLQKGQVFEYLFDFGDGWHHEITVEQIDGEGDDGTYPRIVEKKGHSPPQYPDMEDDDDDAA